MRFICNHCSFISHFVCVCSANARTRFDVNPIAYWLIIKETNGTNNCSDMPITIPTSKKVYNKTGLQPIFLNKIINYFLTPEFCRVLLHSWMDPTSLQYIQRRQNYSPFPKCGQILVIHNKYSLLFRADYTNTWNR